MKNITGLSHGTALVVATIVGGGMFALPLALENVWFTKGVITLAISAFFMLLTGLMLVDVNLRFPSGTSFHTFTKDLLGHRASLVINASFLFVLYLITYAYISGASSAFSGVLNEIFGINGTTWSVLLVTFLVSSLIYMGGTLASYVISFFVAAKFITFFLATGGLIESVKLQYLSDNPVLNGISSLALVIPVCIIAFGFHGSIPSLIKIYGKANYKKVVGSLCAGVFISALIYYYWLTISMGVVDKATFSEIKVAGGNIGPFIRMIEGAKAAASMEIILVFFAMFAILSSLLSASLGLCDYFRDLLKSRMTKEKGILPVLLTYLPPALFCIIKPDGFLLAISYAGIALVIWAVLLPPVLLLVARKKCLEATYNFPLSNNALKLFLVIGTIMWILMVSEVFIH